MTDRNRYNTVIVTANRLLSGDSTIDPIATINSLRNLLEDDEDFHLSEPQRTTLLNRIARIEPLIESAEEEVKPKSAA